DVVTLDFQDPSNPFNDNIPTTLLIDGTHTITIRGSLYANVLILAPEATIQFVNEDCDMVDRVQGIFLAKNFITVQDIYGDIHKNLANTESDKPIRCTDGGLVIE